jgi:hypothetical protein
LFTQHVSRYSKVYFIIAIALLILGGVFLIEKTHQGDQTILRSEEVIIKKPKMVSLSLFKDTKVQTASGEAINRKIEAEDKHTPLFKINNSENKI